MYLCGHVCTRYLPTDDACKSVCFFCTYYVSPLPQGVSAGSIAYLVSGKPFPEFIKALESLAHYPVLWTAGKFVVALPLCYHMINGIRHLVSSTCTYIRLCIYMHYNIM